MPIPPATLDAMEAQLKKLLPPPIGTQTIPTGFGTKEVKALEALLQVLEKKG